METTLNAFRNGVVGFIDPLDPLAWLIKIEPVVEAGRIHVFRGWRILCSGKRSAGRVFYPSIMGVRDNLYVVGMALSIDLKCTFHGHAMNPFRVLNQLCKHHLASYAINLNCIRSPDGIAVCPVRMCWPELH